MQHKPRVLLNIFQNLKIIFGNSRNGQSFQEVKRKLCCVCVDEGKNAPSCMFGEV